MKLEKINFNYSESFNDDLNIESGRKGKKENIINISDNFRNKFFEFTYNQDEINKSIENNFFILDFIDLKSLEENIKNNVFLPSDEEIEASFDDEEDTGWVKSIGKLVKDSKEEINEIIEKLSSTQKKYLSYLLQKYSESRKKIILNPCGDSGYELVYVNSYQEYNSHNSLFKALVNLVSYENIKRQDVYLQGELLSLGIESLTDPEKLKETSENFSGEAINQKINSPSFFKKLKFMWENSDKYDEVNSHDHYLNKKKLKNKSRDKFKIYLNYFSKFGIENSEKILKLYQKQEFIKNKLKIDLPDFTDLLTGEDLDNKILKDLKNLDLEKINFAEKLFKETEEKINPKNGEEIKVENVIFSDIWAKSSNLDEILFILNHVWEHKNFFESPDWKPEKMILHLNFPKLRSLKNNSKFSLYLLAPYLPNIPEKYLEELEENSEDARLSENYACLNFDLPENQKSEISRLDDRDYTFGLDENEVSFINILIEKNFTKIKEVSEVLGLEFSPVALFSGRPVVGYSILDKGGNNFLSYLKYINFLFENLDSEILTFMSDNFEIKDLWEVLPMAYAYKFLGEEWQSRVLRFKKDASPDEKLDIGNEIHFICTTQMQVHEYKKGEMYKTSSKLKLSNALFEDLSKLKKEGFPSFHSEDFFKNLKGESSESLAVIDLSFNYKVDRLRFEVERSGNNEELNKFKQLEDKTFNSWEKAIFWLKNKDLYHLAVEKEMIPKFKDIKYLGHDDGDFHKSILNKTHYDSLSEPLLSNFYNPERVKKILALKNSKRGIDEFLEIFKPLGDFENNNDELIEYLLFSYNGNYFEILDGTPNFTDLDVSLIIKFFDKNDSIEKKVLEIEAWIKDGKETVASTHFNFLQNLLKNNPEEFSEILHKIFSEWRHISSSLNYSGTLREILKLLRIDINEEVLKYLLFDIGESESSGEELKDEYYPKFYDKLSKEYLDVNSWTEFLVYREYFLKDPEKYKLENKKIEDLLKKNLNKIIKFSRDLLQKFLKNGSESLSLKEKSFLKFVHNNEISFLTIPDNILKLTYNLFLKSEKEDLEDDLKNNLLEIENVRFFDADRSNLYSKLLALPKEEQIILIKKVKTLFDKVKGNRKNRIKKKKEVIRTFLYDFLTVAELEKFVISSKSEENTGLMKRIENFEIDQITEQKDEILNGIKDNLENKFNINLPEKNIDEMLKDKSFLNLLLFSVNINQPTEEKLMVLGFFAGLQLHGEWENFINGKKIDLKIILKENAIEAVQKYLENRTKIFDLLKSWQINPEILSSEEENIYTGEITPMYESLESFNGEFQEIFLDPDVYGLGDNIDKSMIRDLFEKYEISDFEAFLKNYSDTKNINTDFLKDIKNIFKNLKEASIKDILKFFITFLKFSEKLETEKNTHLNILILKLKESQKPNQEIISIFNDKMSVLSFSKNSSIHATREDINAMRKKSEISDLTENENIIIKNYLNNIEENLIEIEMIQKKYMNQLNQLKDLHKNPESHQKDLFERINGGLREALEKITPFTAEIKSILTTNPEKIMSHTRACLNPLEKQCNNDVVLYILGDPEVFHLQSYANENNISDQLCYLLPQKDEKKSPLFVLDTLYGNKSDDIIISHILVILKKMKSLNAKSKFFIPSNALGGINLEKLKNKLENIFEDGEKISGSEEEINLIPASIGDVYNESLNSGVRDSGISKNKGLLIEI